MADIAVSPAPEAPVFYVKLLAQKGATPNLSASSNVDLSEYILSLEFEDKGRCADKLILHVKNYDLKFFDDQTWRAGNLLEVSWGYPFNLSPPRVVIIDKVTGFNELKVEGHCKSMLLNKVTGSEVFHQQTRSDVVKTVLKRYGYTDQDLGYIEDTKVVLPSIVKPKMTDAQFIQNLATREGFDFFVDFDGPHWHQPAFDQAPIRSYTWYTGDTGTIKDIKIKNDVLSQPAVVITAGRDIKSKQTFTNLHSDSTVTRAGNAPNLSASVTDNTKKTVEKTTPDAIDRLIVNPETRDRDRTQIIPKATGKDVAKREGDAAFKRSMQMSVKLTAEIIGDPKLVAKTNIEIQGISKRLSGRYYIDKIKHKLSKNGYGCSLECHRTGDGDPSGQKANAKINTEKAKDSAEATKRLVASPETRDSYYQYVDSKGRAVEPTIDASKK